MIDPNRRIRVRRGISNSHRREIDGNPRHHTYSLSIPPALGRSLYGTWEFTAEITEAGILFRPVAINPDVEAVWVDEKEDDDA